MDTGQQDNLTTRLTSENMISLDGSQVEARYEPQNATHAIVSEENIFQQNNRRPRRNTAVQRSIVISPDADEHYFGSLIVSNSRVSVIGNALGQGLSMNTYSVLEPGQVGSSRASFSPLNRSRNQ